MGAEAATAARLRHARAVAKTLDFTGADTLTAYQIALLVPDCEVIGKRATRRLLGRVFGVDTSPWKNAPLGVKKGDPRLPKSLADEVAGW